MPRRDGTGPLGQGEMTGRGLGFCNNSINFKRGIGLGYARGLNLRFNNFNSQFSYKQLLLEQKAQLESRLEIVNRALEKMD